MPRLPMTEKRDAAGSSKRDWQLPGLPSRWLSEIIGPGFELFARKIQAFKNNCLTG